jgi:uncharacterized membrane protein YqiK
MSFFETFLSSAVLIALIFIGAISVMVLRFFAKVEQGKALIVNTMGTEPVVTFTGRVVLPVVHKAEIMDISLKTIEIDRRGKEGLICKDNIRADIKVAFFVRVNKTKEDVLKVAQSIGCVRGSDPATLEELFSAKFSEALKTVGKQLDFEDLYKERDSFRDSIIEVIGKDLNGYVLEDAAIDFLEQTPLSSLDPNNILDAQGIRKITDVTSHQHVLTNEFENQGRMKITEQNVRAREAILEMERRQTDAEAKQRREIETTKAHEQAEIDAVAARERLRSETERLQTEEKLAIQTENKQREQEVAAQNRLRVVGIESERVQLAREQEIIARERETELQRIAKEKALEEEKRAIADVIRERIAVERTVAEEEERIKETRVLAEAMRTKQARIIAAEAEAQEVLVKDIKAAEAAQESAKYHAQEQIIMAEAERETAEKRTQAKIRLAEGIQAEEAAKGLAQVKIKEAEALAVEKMGSAEAKALLEKMSAQAEGTRLQGMAEVHVREAEAEVIQRRGMAEVAVREADAVAIEKQGEANAKALEEKLMAEAKGLAEKFKSLDALSEGGRAHEEFRYHMEQELKLAEAHLEAQKVVAEKQALILAEAFKNAKIDIIGGEQMFFERMLEATSLAKSFDGFVRNSNTGQTLFKDYLNGDADLMRDLKEILANPAFSSDDIQNLTLSAFLAKAMQVSSGDQKNKLQALQKWIGQKGLAEIKAQM